MRDLGINLKLTLYHLKNLIRIVPGRAGMGDHKNRAPLVPIFGQQSINFPGGHLIEIAGGFVSQQQWWFKQRCPGNRRPLPLPGAQLPWFMVHAVRKSQTR